MPPLRVCFALPGLHRVNRGAEVVLEEVARRLAQTPDFDITLIGTGQPREGEPYRFIHASGLRREVFEKFPKFPYIRDHYAWEELAFAPGLWRKYRPSDFDLTVTCGYPYTNWLLRRGRKNHRPRHVFITQNGDWMVQAKNWEFKHFSCDGLICTNPEFFDRHKDRYPAALIPNGVDVDRFKPKPSNTSAADRAAWSLPPDLPIILIVSALIPSKRVLEGIHAASKVENAFLLIAGDGEQRETVDQTAHNLLGDRYKRVTATRAQMPDLYRNASVLLHMSQDEPFGNIYIEALATGLPIVAHKTPVTCWIVQNQGNLVDTSDSHTVTEELRQAILPSDMSQIEARRRLAVDKFSWSSIARQYGEFLTTVSQSPG